MMKIIGVYQPWSAPIIHLKLPSDLLNGLIELTDLVASDSPKFQEDMGEHLAGELEKEWMLDYYMLEQVGFTDYAEKISLTYFDVLQRQFPVYVSEGNSGPLTDGSLVNFKKEIQEARLTTAWFNDMQDNEYNPMHHHGGILSGVIYLKIPQYLPDRKDRFHSGPQLDGSISFTNNTNNLDQKMCTSLLSYSPETGDCFLFPAGQNHQVYPFRTVDGKGIRRSFAFNIGEW